MVRQIILAGFAVILPAGAQAQGRVMMAPISRGVAVGPRVAMQAPRVGTAQAISGTRVAPRGGVVRARTVTPNTRSTRRQGTTRMRFEDENNRSRPDCNSAPGLGFDAAHLAAICGPTTFGSRTNGFGFPFFFPFFDSGFSQPGSTGSVDEGSAAESSQPEAADAEVRERSRRNRGAEPTEPAAEAASAAPADNEQYVFVRRDGTVFFAVAYAWERGTLRYITSQGLRRSVTQDALDLDATRQFNEQRGLNFRLPA